MTDIPFLQYEETGVNRKDNVFTEEHLKKAVEALRESELETGLLLLPDDIVDKYIENKAVPPPSIVSKKSYNKLKKHGLLGSVSYE